MLKDSLLTREKSALGEYTTDLEGQNTPFYDQADGEASEAEDLIGRMVHEMQNCLQGISLGLDLLRVTHASSPECGTIARGVTRLSRLLGEMHEYFSPPGLYPCDGALELVVEEVAQQAGEEWSSHAARLHIVYRDPIPPLRLDWRQFRNALERVLAFSFALLPAAKGIEIAAGVRDGAGKQYVELTVTGPCCALVGDSNVFQPLLRIRGYHVGLSLWLARLLLQRQGGDLLYHVDKRRKQGVFTFLLRVR
jgi:hypothetical protein